MPLLDTHRADAPRVDVHRPDAPRGFLYERVQKFGSGSYQATPRPGALSPAELAALELDRTSCERGHQRITYRGTDACPLCDALEKAHRAQVGAVEALNRSLAFQDRAHRAELEASKLKSAAPLPAESVVYKGATPAELRVIAAARGIRDARPHAWDELCNALYALDISQPGRFR